MYYENIPCSVFLSASHISSKCPFREKPALLPSSAPIIQEKTPSSQVTADPNKASVVSAEVIQSSKASPVPNPPEQLGSSDLIGPIVVEETSNSNGNSLSPPTHSLSSPAPVTPGLHPVHDPLQDNPIFTLPSDLAFEILGKIHALF